MPYDFTYMWNLKNQNKQAEQKLTHRYRDILTVAIWERVWGLGEGIKKYRLVVTKQSWGCKVEHRKHSQSFCNNYVWCQRILDLLGW